MPGARHPLTVAEVAELLNRRAAALVAGDEAAFAATVADPQSSTGRRQLASYEAARSLGIASLEVDQPVITGDHAQVDVRYRLTGLDRGDRVARLDYTVIRSGSGWAVVSERPSGAGATAPWVAMPDLRVQRGEHSVIAGTVSAAGLAEYAAVVDRAVSRCCAETGPAPRGRCSCSHPPPSPRPTRCSAGRPARAQPRGWPRSRRPPRVPPARTAERRGTGSSWTPRRTPGSQPAGRDVVLTHELAHVAVRATVPGAPATWLAEGYADHVGYARAGLSDQRLLAPLLAEVRAGRGAGGPPRQQ